jgi:hypothetical protein
MPLKIIWALLDVMTLIVLGSGLYLWGERLYIKVPMLGVRAFPNHPGGQSM